MEKQDGQQINALLISELINRFPPTQQMLTMKIIPEGGSKASKSEKLRRDTMEELEDRGIVGPENGSSPREIMVDLDSM